MRPTLAWLLVLAGCPGGSGALGEVCGDTGDCASSLQCLANACVPRCQRAPECGDGFACDKSGICVAATGQSGDTCTSEVGCTSGLSCQIDGTAQGPSGLLLASCTAQNDGQPAGATCTADDTCRDGTCALGHCVDLCADTRDCAVGASCVQLPRHNAAFKQPPGQGVGQFKGCLPSQGSISFAIPIVGPKEQDVILPVASSATSVSVLFSVDDRNQDVGATKVVAPDGTIQYTLACNPPTACDMFYEWPIRHAPAPGNSVLAIPTSPAAPLQAGVYQVDVASLRSDLAPGSAIPKVTVIEKLDTGVVLDLHFHFLDLEDHPCQSQLGVTTLASGTAQAAAFFQNDFLGELRGIFAHGGVALGTLTYDDVANHPDLDGLDLADAPSLLALGNYAGGINVFFVRTLSPVGLQAFGPNPGPAGLAGTPQSGIAIGVDTLCYRTWKQVARLTAHELARYMGLYHNAEAELDQHDKWHDTIDDSDDSSNNLMFYSEFGGADLSGGQSSVLAKSPVLR